VAELGPHELIDQHQRDGMVNASIAHLAVERALLAPRLRMSKRNTEWDGIQAGCVVHRRVATWHPWPMWWHHGLDPCPYLLNAPAPLPRDKPWICGRYGELGKPQSYIPR
jgi:hypothetical protein